MYFDSVALNHPLSATSDADPDDVLSAKSAFNQLGYYEVPSYGLTPYPDEPLFDGIRDYQKDKGLTVDGYMLPEGETEQSVNKSLASNARGSKNSTNVDDACAEPAIQAWQLPSWGKPPARNYCPVLDGRPSEEDCERQAVEDEGKCKAIWYRYGAYRAQRCLASATLRYGNCKAGRWDFPKLDTGEY